MQTILITGGTGLVGKNLTKQLVAKGYKIIILTRSLKGVVTNDAIRYATWDIKKQIIDIEAVQSADFIIHLAGAGVVEKKWTASYKKEIEESRTLSSKLLTDTLKNNVNKVKAIISASAIGWYGEDVERGHLFIETDKASGDFLGRTCLLWEQSIDAAKDFGIRICRLRTGIALSNEGGALSEFVKPLKAGIAAILGSGKQMISWIHMDDLCRIYMYAIENENMSGNYNAVAPEPVSNKEFMLTLAQQLRGTFYIPLHIPGFILRLMMGERSREVLKSTTVSCARIKEAGFTFLFPSLKAALEQLTRE